MCTQSTLHCAQALRTGGDTSKVDTAYDTLRDEDRRREYDRRHAGGGGSSARRDTGDSYEVVERGSGEVKDWASAGGQAAGGDGDTAQLSLGKLAGLLNEAVTGGRLCAPIHAWVLCCRIPLPCSLICFLALLWSKLQHSGQLLRCALTN